MKYLNDPRLTAFDTESRTITACYLLNCFLEFAVLVPDTADWIEERLAANPPRLYRLKQLNSMLHAFHLGDLSSFESGGFIEHDNGPRYAKALELISKGAISFDRSNELVGCFNILMRFRQEVEDVLSFGSGAYHIGLRLQWNTYCRIWNFIWIMKEEVKSLDSIIVAIISPEEKSFTIDELVRDHGFPDVNITEIDLDHL